ncbi:MULTISPECIES: PE-PPE domain-containing protein [unclassified Mycobacterium]|uniref:PE-PPE domain-containing protein n=1 Tax=unclassified Mycobacterium TaxID=2642494 RepID=UPI00068B5F9F|nr:MULTISPECIES: PE-PPE domain-containing protein [unclassified Mycobacterium]SDZ89668.1 PE-PPE domain-containing protein [Mycobacterium sp. 283mftsu]
MRTFGRTIPAAAAVMLTVLSTVLLGVVSMVTAAFTLAATALIVPGTGTPNANIVAGYRENSDNYYIAPFNPLCTQPTCTLKGINYPAQFWPIPLPGWGGLSGAKWNDSTGQGIQALDTALQLALPTATPQNPVIIFGYSQGGNIVSREKSTLGGLTQAQKDALAFVMIGNTNRPNGGLFERLALLGTVPIWDVTFGLPAPTNTGIKTTDIAFEYDGVADFPLYPINLLADLNAIAGFWYVHGTYLAPNANSDVGEIPDLEYTAPELNAALTDPKNQTVYGDTTYITIPTKTLPIVRPFLEFGGFTHTSFIIKPIVDLVSPVLRVLIDTGYDRSLSPGVPAPFRLIPLLNPITLTVDLINAAGQGVKAAISDITGGKVQLPIAATTPAPTPTTVAARNASSTPTAVSATPTGDTKLAPATAPKLSTTSDPKDTDTKDTDTKGTDTKTPDTKTPDTKVTDPKTTDTTGPKQDPKPGTDPTSDQGPAKDGQTSATDKGGEKSGDKTTDKTGDKAKKPKKDKKVKTPKAVKPAAEKADKPAKAAA